MSKILYQDKRHNLEIVKENETQPARIVLKHHGVVFLDVHPEAQEIQILKELFNRIVDNHNTLENYFKKH